MYKETRSILGWIITIGIIVTLLIFLAIQTLTLTGLLDGFGRGFSPGSDASIGVLNLDGPLLTADRYRRVLQKYKNRDHIEAVLLDVDSPGGGVAVSQELASAVEKIRAAGKPVVTSVRSVGASGAYYVAVSSDTIVANPGSAVGSIGVIMQFFRAEELMDTIGLDYEVVKSGKFKDIGSPFRELKESERELLRDLVLDVYDQFIRHILEHRPDLGETRLRNLADGRIFTGSQALEEGLIDRLGTRSKALEILRTEANLSETAETVDLSREREGVFDSTFQLFQTWLDAAQNEHGKFRLLYMMPGFSGRE